MKISLLCYPSEDERNHCPLLGNSGRSEFLNIPPLRPGCRHAKARNHKEHRWQKCSVEQLADWRGNDGEGQVEHALAGVVRADKIAEHALFRQRVFYQASKVAVTAVLLQPGEEEKRGANSELSPLYGPACSRIL